MLLLFVLLTCAVARLAVRPLAALEAKTKVETQVRVEADVWASCASEKQSCNFLVSDASPYVVRYGAGKFWRYQIVSAPTTPTGSFSLSVPCDPKIFGTSGATSAGSCSVKRLDMNKNSTVDQFQWPKSWSKIADFNADFTLPASACKTNLRWVRYRTQVVFPTSIGGTPTGSTPEPVDLAYFYKLVKDGAVCSGTKWFGYTGVTPFELGAQCDVGDVCVDFGQPSFCATQNQTCSFGVEASDAFQVVSYVGGGKGAVELLSRPSIPCTLGDIGTGPSDTGVRKDCMYYAPNTFFNRIGYWQFAARGSRASITLEQGYSRERTVTLGQDFGTKFTVGFEAGFDFVGATAKASYSAELSWSEREEISAAASQTISKTCSVECPDGFPNLYQWKLSSDEVCDIGDASCDVTLGTCFFSCRSVAAPPSCSFSDCCDEFCNVCRPKNGVCPSN